MTKMLLQDAFLELLEEKRYEKITITDICGKADVNRSTFYSYYDGVEQLLTEIEDRAFEHLPLNENFSDIITAPENYIATFENYFKYIKDNERLFRVLMIHADSYNFGYRVLKTFLHKYMNSAAADGRDFSEYAYIYLIHGVLGLVSTWIVKGFSLSPATLAKMVVEIIYCCPDFSEFKAE